MRSLFQSKNSPPILELHCWKNPRIPPKFCHNHISFTVKDLDYEYKRLRRLGVKFISKPIKTPYANTKVCFCYDPDKNLIEFIEDLK
jgi:catechol 2,3-dioxygenase-like lactoylglutathione lyase family enzyme